MAVRVDARGARASNHGSIEAGTRAVVVDDDERAARMMAHACMREMDAVNTFCTIVSICKVIVKLERRIEKLERTGEHDDAKEKNLRE